MSGGADPCAVWYPPQSASLARPGPALGKLATGSGRVYQVISRVHYILTAVLSPGDPVQRHPVITWDVDEARASVEVVTLENDLEVLVASGGAPLSNKTRWDSLTFWVSKTNSGNEWHIWTAHLGGSEIGYGRFYANLGNPITAVGRIGTAGPVPADVSKGLRYTYEGATIPNGSVVEYRFAALGWSTEDGELPAADGVGQVIPKMEGLGTEVG